MNIRIGSGVNSYYQTGNAFRTISSTNSAFSVPTATELLSKNSITDEQKKYLSNKYDLDNLYFYGDIPANGPERTFYEKHYLGVGGGKSKNLPEFLKELKQMSLISEE